MAPELTVTLPPLPAAAGPGGAAAQRQRPAAVADRAAAEGLLSRMARLQAAAAELLQEQATATKCTFAAADLRGLMAAVSPGAASSALVVARQQEAEKQQQRQQQQQRRGSSAAAAQRLAQLRQLQAAGSQLASQLA